MARRAGNVVDQNGRPMEGVQIFVYTLNVDGTVGALASLTTDTNAAIVQPVVTGTSGEYAINGATGIYHAQYRFAGKLFRVDEVFTIGSTVGIFTDVIQATEDARDAAIDAAAEAEAARAAAVAAIGSDDIYLTKQLADDNLAGVAANAWVRVQQDETRNGQSWLYQKVSGSYVSRGPADVSNIVAGESRRNDVQRIMRTNTSRGSRARAVIIMDDGYRSNFTVMAPILERRGQVACIAAEIDRIGSPYTITDTAPTNRGTVAYPTCTPADYRELINRGWQVLNHMAQPAGGASLPTVVSGYRAENRLLQQILTGAKVPTGTLGTFTDATPTNPEFDDYAVTGGVYRGGVNDPTSDKAASYIFDTGVRDVPGLQDQPYLYFFDGAKPTNVAGYVIDTSNRPLREILATLDGLAATDATIILYGHHTPIEAERTTVPPCLTDLDLEAISRKLYELGIQTCTWSQAFPGNIVPDPRFDLSHGTFAAASGDTAAFVTGSNILGGARKVRLTTTAFQGTPTTNYRVDLATQPFHIYRVRIGYTIGTELTVNGGSGNRNHGLAVTATHIQIGGAAYSAGTANDWDMNGAFVLTASATSTTSVAVGAGAKTFTIATGLNIYAGQPFTVYRTSDFGIWMKGYVQAYDAGTGSITLYMEDFRGTGTFTDWTFEAYRRPFRSTSGEVHFHECLIPSLDGFLTQLLFGIIQCTGTVDIEHLSVEDLGSYEKNGLTFPTAVNTTVPRNITLPSLPQSNNRRRRWRGEVTMPAAAPTFTTVTFAEEDSAAISSPATGNTAYVLGKGVGAFANNGGMIATWNGSAWTFAAPSDRSWIRCNGISQGIGGGRRWFHRFRSNAAGAINIEVFADEPIRDGHVVINGTQARVSNWTGGRSDPCVLHVFPAWESPSGF